MRLLLATVWTLIGAAITAGVYWAFLITPESSVLALLASAVLSIIALVLAAFTINGTIEIWSRGFSFGGVLRSMRAIAFAIPAALIVLLMWWLTTRFENAIAMRSGQINAMFIARFGWDDISWLFTSIRYLAIWLRWVVASLLALSLMAAGLSAGWPALGQAAWLRRALHPRAIAVATLWFVVLIAVPWTVLVPWRPQNLPPTSAEFAFIAAKLTLSALLAAIGTALIVNEASRWPAAPQNAQ